MDPVKKKLKGMVITFAWELFTDSSDSDEYEGEEEEQEDIRRRKVAKVAKVILPPDTDIGIPSLSMSDDDFKSYLRVSRSTFATLNRRLETYLMAGGERTNSLALETSKMLLITLCLLGSQESYSSVADRFGVSKSTVYRSLVRTVNALLAISYKERVIAWPSPSRAAEIIQTYQQKYNFPGAVGAIDCFHIETKPPRATASSYVNSHGSHSVLLQAVCDVDYNFIDCYAGELGSVSTSCVFGRSTLPGMIERKEVLGEEEQHILGNSTYPLMNSLLVPFPSHAQLSMREERFNTRFSAAHSTVAQTFALLKGRFRRLKQLELNITEFLPNVIMACCVLHNLCMAENDQVEPLDESNGFTEVETDQADAFIESFQGQLKRNRIADALH